MHLAPLDRRRRPLWVAGAVVVGAVVLGTLAGCGSQGAGATIDAAKLNNQISTGLAHRLGIPAPPVRCPGGQANRRGTTFRCSTEIDSQPLAITAAVSDGQGDVHWQPSDALISTPETAAAIDRQFGAQLRSSITADCGTHPLAVVAIGASITCAATVNGSARHVTVTARDLAGNVDLSLDPPATGPQSTSPPVTAAPTPGSLPLSPSTLPGD
ncbi:MAG: DUF4333 domain-containing protein [Acidimicrobiales bacterium]